MYLTLAEGFSCWHGILLLTGCSTAVDEIFLTWHAAMGRSYLVGAQLLTQVPLLAFSVNLIVLQLPL
jgi:hypothetical protein